LDIDFLLVIVDRGREFARARPGAPRSPLSSPTFAAPTSLDCRHGYDGARVKPVGGGGSDDGLALRPINAMTVLHGKTDGAGCARPCVAPPR
jgi:hypothetical protein